MGAQARALARGRCCARTRKAGALFHFHRLLRLHIASRNKAQRLGVVLFLGGLPPLGWPAPLLVATALCKHAIDAILLALMLFLALFARVELAAYPLATLKVYLIAVLLVLARGHRAELNRCGAMHEGGTLYRAGGAVCL